MKGVSEGVKKLAAVNWGCYGVVYEGIMRDLREGRMESGMTEYGV